MQDDSINIFNVLQQQSQNMQNWVQSVEMHGTEIYNCDDDAEKELVAMLHEAPLQAEESIEYNYLLGILHVTQIQNAENKQTNNKKLQKWCAMVNSISVETNYTSYKRIRIINLLLALAPKNAGSTSEYMYLVKLKELLEFYNV